MRGQVGYKISQSCIVMQINIKDDIFDIFDLPGP